MSFHLYRYSVKHFEKRHIEQKQILRHSSHFFDIYERLRRGNSNGTPSHSESNSNNILTLINVHSDII